MGAWKKMLYGPEVKPVAYPENFTLDRVLSRSITPEERKKAAAAYESSSIFAARRWYETAKKDDALGKALDGVNAAIAEKAAGTLNHSDWEDLLFGAADKLPKVDDLGLSVGQAGWAIQAAAGAYKEDKEEAA